jgi:hypothetical protein
VCAALVVLAVSVLAAGAGLDIAILKVEGQGSGVGGLSSAVQMQFMRPGQLEAAMRAFPAVYVPFGLVEWHGRHLPLGNDAIKAHAFLVRTAGGSWGY